MKWWKILLIVMFLSFLLIAFSSVKISDITKIEKEPAICPEPIQCPKPTPCPECQKCPGPIFNDFPEIPILKPKDLQPKSDFDIQNNRIITTQIQN